MQRWSSANRWLFLNSTTKVSTHNLNHVSNPNSSLQAEKRDKLKQISKSHDDYFSSARISFLTCQLVQWNVMQLHYKIKSHPSTVYQLWCGPKPLPDYLRIRECKNKPDIITVVWPHNNDTFMFFFYFSKSWLDSAVILRHLTLELII